MNRIPLAMKPLDVLKMQMKLGGIPLLLGLAFGVYFSKVPVSTALVYMPPALILMEAIVLFVVCKATNMFLTKEGLLYINWRGRHVVYSWDNPMEISLLKSRPDFYLIEYTDKRKKMYVHKVIFSYPEVAKIIAENAPISHKFRELAANGS